MGPFAPSELTCLMGFHQVAVEAASEYVLSSEKLNPACRPEDDVDQFSEFRFRDQYQAYIFLANET